MRSLILVIIYGSAQCQHFSKWMTDIDPLLTFKTGKSSHSARASRVCNALLARSCDTLRLTAIYAFAAAWVCKRRATRRISVKGATPKLAEFVYCADRLPTLKHLHPFE